MVYKIIDSPRVLVSAMTENQIIPLSTLSYPIAVSGAYGQLFT